MDRCEPSMRCAGSGLGAKRHICAFFDAPKQEYRLLLPFIKEGSERAERAFHVVGGSLQENPFCVPPEEFLSELRQRGRELVTIMGQHRRDAGASHE